MNKPARHLAQAALYVPFIAVIGYFSTSPPYALRGPDDAVLRLSVTHAGQVKQPCRRRTEEELARLAPNMRTAFDCPRERSPIEVELTLDGRPLYRASVPPVGLARDGMSSVHERFTVPSGSHELRARLKDHLELDNFNYAKEDRVTLASGQVLVVDFNASRGGFEFR